MTDRGLPSVDGAPACPFVALEDDRDERASSPDHRHRCYAEVRPAPRALAHQEAYCLSSAFPVCPTFQDWARREAARARAVDQPSEPEPPRRNPPREWSAPPPWVAEDDDPDRPRPPTAEEFLASRDRPGSGLAGSAADRLAGGTIDDAAAGAVAGPPAGPSPTAPVDDRSSGPAADRPAGSRPWERAWSDDEAPADDEDDAYDEDDADADDEHGAEPPRGRARREPSGGALFGDRRPRVGQTRPRKPANDLSGPAWERPRRYEAYPTLRRRLGMPRVPPTAIAAVALVLAAVAFFFLPQFLGIGSRDGDGAGTVPTASPSASASAGLPTATPAPTPRIYIVTTGDTLSRIATSNGVSIEDLLAANPNITDPDQIAIGDEVIIPVVGVPLPSELEGSGDAPTASPSP